MIKFIYAPDENAFKKSNMQIEMILPDDINLSGLFNNFVELTRIMGYHSKSWSDLIKDIVEADISTEEYTLFDYATDNNFFNQ